MARLTCSLHMFEERDKFPVMGNGDENIWFEVEQMKGRVMLQLQSRQKYGLEFTSHHKTTYSW